MIEAHIPVGLVIERRTLTGPWGGHAWAPVTLFTTLPEVTPWTPLGGSAETTRYYAGEATVHLYSTETTNYRDNLETGAPKLWVVMRPEGPEPPVAILAVTADPAEGEANTETGTNLVETLPMPDDIRALVADFVANHHVERPIIKRKRDRAAPEVKWRMEGPAENPKNRHDSE